jgi:hypothetical protein
VDEMNDNKHSVGKKSDVTDERWGGYVPWFLRHNDFSGTGNFILFFERLSHRLFQLLFYNEVGISNMMHFGSLLESKSLQRYRHVNKPHYLINNPVPYSVRDFFDPKTLETEMSLALRGDPIEKKLLELGNRITMGRLSAASRPSDSQEFAELKVKAEASRSKRIEAYYRPVFIERLGVLEAMLRILPKESDWWNDFIVDVRRYFAEAAIMLDVNKQTLEIELLEEPLLQSQVIDNLLPRLRSRFPDRADELVRAYHGMLDGTDFDEIFVGAFKTLEEIGRSLTGDSKFEFSLLCLQKHYSGLHKTIHSTIVKLDAHRGDRAGHGKTTPQPHEMRYLLFSICNIALLMLDYSSQ